MSAKSLRRIRFETVAARRVQRIIEQLDSLSNCSNRNNYEYSEEDIRKMFNAIRESLKTTESSFDKEINRINKNKFKF